MFKLIDHRLVKGDPEREQTFDTLEAVKKWIGADFEWCESVDDVNDHLREWAEGEAYYELFEGDQL